MNTVKIAAGKHLFSIPGDTSSPEARALIKSIVRQFLTLGDTERLRFDLDDLYEEKEQEYLRNTIERERDLYEVMKAEGLIH